MECTMKKRYTISTMVSTAAVLAACGGGGGASSDTNNPSPPTSKSSFNLTGTVPGTLIEAFCDDGSYYVVNSEKNATSEHPFTLSLPTSLSCRLVMTTNEDDPENKVVTPILFINNEGEKSIAFSSEQDVDLSHINLALDRSEMQSDDNDDGVEDIPKEIILDFSDSSKIKIIVKDDDPLDKDDNGIIDIYEDDDGDRIPNKDDDDDDGDGILDINDGDDDNDGIEDEVENEEDQEDNESDDGEIGGGGSNPPVIVTTPSAGRLLASQCAQCHRTDANPNKGFEDLIGEEIYGDLDEMKRESKRELMHLQANGYTNEQIILIDDYFNNLSENRGGE